MIRFIFSFLFKSNSSCESRKHGRRLGPRLIKAKPKLWRTHQERCPNCTVHCCPQHPSRSLCSKALAAFFLNAPSELHASPRQSGLWCRCQTPPGAWVPPPDLKTFALELAGCDTRAVGTAVSVRVPAVPDARRLARSGSAVSCDPFGFCLRFACMRNPRVDVFLFRF